MSVDVHKRAAYEKAKDAAGKQGEAERMRRHARAQREDGDRIGAAWSQLLALMLQSDFEQQFREVRALQAENNLDPDEEPEGAEVEIPDPWTL